MRTSDVQSRANGGDGRRKRLITMCAGFCVLCVVAVGALTTLGGAKESSAAPSPKTAGLHVTINNHTYSVPSCPDVSKVGALHISGKLLLKANGQGFAYYGITVFGGLEQGGNDAAWQAGEGAAMAQIKASTWWHANTVRIQLAEQDVFDKGNPSDGVNTAFLHAVCTEVQQVRRQHQEVVLSDQTEWPDWTEHNPTTRSADFWKVIGAMLRNQIGVSFDIYNEPRLNYPKPTSSYHGHYPKYNMTWIWKHWLNGATVGGQKFLGMQQLYNDVRHDGINNIIWIEGPLYDNTLGLGNKYMVKGKNIVLSIHHPGLTNATNWASGFGYLAATYPMVDGEWGQYAAARPECRAGAEKVVGPFLKYLRSKNIGMLGWSLQPGSMLADPHHYMPTNTTAARDTTNPDDLRVPSRMYPNYSCTNKDIGEGAGRMLMNYFKQYSHLPTS